jgi:hypothetical protein
VLDPKQLRLFVIRPTLQHIGLLSASAELLLLATAAHESGLANIDQRTGPNDETLGPAMGLWQIEAPTLYDITDRYLAKPSKAALRERVFSLMAPAPQSVIQLATNACFACAIARVRYYMAPEPLPEPDDLEGMAHYWKRFYNTSLGAGTPEKFLESYRRILGVRNI